MNEKTIDVIIPVYQPDKKFARLLAMLEKQTVPVNRIIVMKTERELVYEGRRIGYTAGMRQASARSRIWRSII